MMNYEDYEHVWRSSLNSSPTMRRNNLPYMHYFNEPYCVPRNDIHPFIDDRQYPNFVDYSSGPQGVNDINGNLGYHSFHSHYVPVEDTPTRAFNSCQFPDSDFGSVEKIYHPQINYEEQIIEHPQATMTNLDAGVSHSRPNSRKRKRNRSRKSKDIPTNNFSDCNAEKNKSQNTTDFPSDISDIQLFINNKEDNECKEFQIISKQNSTDDRNRVLQVNESVNHAESPTIYQFDDLNYKMCGVTDINMSAVNQPAQLLTDSVEGKEDMNNQLVSRHANFNLNEASHISAANFSNDQSEQPSANISDSANAEILNLDLSHFENIDLQNLYVTTLFGGKDNCGQDIVLLATPDIQPEKLLENRHGQLNVQPEQLPENIMQLTETKNALGMSNATASDNYSNTHMNHEAKESGNESLIIFSDIDDYAYEETVETSQSISFNVKKTKTKKDKTADQTQLPMQKQMHSQKGNHDENHFTSEASTSNQIDIHDSTANTAETLPQVNHKSKKGKKTLRKRSQRKTKEILYDLQKGIFSFQTFIRKVLNGNHHGLKVMHSNIQREIGDQVLRTIYKSFHTIIRDYDLQSRRTIKTKKILKVKMPIKKAAGRKRNQNI